MTSVVKKITAFCLAQHYFALHKLPHVRTTTACQHILRGHPGVVQAYRDSHSVRIKRSQVSQVISQLLELVLFFVPKILELRMPFLVLRRAFLMLMRPFLMLRRPWRDLRNEMLS